MPAPTMLWYDYETTGTDPARDRPVQFAAIRTDLDLVQVDAPVNHFCRPAPDVLPQPDACLVTGIAPQDAARDGIDEAGFAGIVHAAMAQPGTCSVGYNSIRFDDEVNRYLFYRNFFDPYEHAWRGGNSRWDILDLVRACYALRPDGVEWPHREDGKPSFKLEHLAPANRLDQAHAHDALSDATATLGLARLIRAHHPKLYDWHFRLRAKRSAASLLAHAAANRQALLHVSGRYPAARGCTALVLPLCEHPDRAGTWIVADLATAPADWAGLDADDLLERLFTAARDLPDDIVRPPLKEVHSNKSPFVAPVSVLQGVDAARICLDRDQCERHREALLATHGLVERVRRAFAAGVRQWPDHADPELALYGAFASDADRRQFTAVRATPPAQLAAGAFQFGDPKYAELLFRYRARNWPDALTPDEQVRWRDCVRARLAGPGDDSALTLARYFARIRELRSAVPAGPKQALLDRLQDWGETVRREFDA